MVDGAVKIGETLLPELIKLEAALNEESEKDTLATTKRDLEAIERDAHIRGHSQGWGGTIVKIDTAWAVVEHIEARISWCVWQLMQKDEGFDFQKWLLRWNPESEQNGTDQPVTRPESKPEGNQKPQPESEGRSR
jgi:hypothetical protein